MMKSKNEQLIEDLARRIGAVAEDMGATIQSLQDKIQAQGTVSAEDISDELATLAGAVETLERVGKTPKQALTETDRGVIPVGKEGEQGGGPHSPLGIEPQTTGPGGNRPLGEVGGEFVSTVRGPVENTSATGLSPQALGHESPSSSSEGSRGVMAADRATAAQEGQMKTPASPDASTGATTRDGILIGDKGGKAPEGGGGPTSESVPAAGAGEGDQTSTAPSQPSVDELFGATTSSEGGGSEVVSPGQGSGGRSEGDQTTSSGPNAGGGSQTGQRSE